MEEKILVDRNRLEDISMKIAHLQSEMIVLMELVDDIPSNDMRKVEYQNKTLAIDLIAIARDCMSELHDKANTLIANGGGKLYKDRIIQDTIVLKIKI